MNGAQISEGSRLIAGTAFFIGGVQYSVAFVLAEVLYPGYNVSSNYISDLGATCREASCQVYQPSATIIDASLITFGLLILLGSYEMTRLNAPRLLVALVVIAGVGGVLNGAFSETAMNAHLVASLVFNVSAALAAVAAYRIENAPLRYFSVAMGIATLAAIALLAMNSYLGLGPGGMERMAAYPILLWTIGFGGYLMGTAGSR